MNGQNNHKYNIEAPVELIYGAEKAEDENSDFRGFLSNLGKEVTATFAEKYEVKPEKDIVDDPDQGQVSISLVGKNKILPVKELQVDEDTNTIKCVVVENDEAEEIEEEILRLEIENDSNTENSENTELDMKIIDVDALIIANGIEEIDNSANQRKNLVRKRTEDVLHDESDDLFEKEMRFPCDICGKIFEYPGRLKAHRRRIHFNQVKAYYCNICGYKNNTLSGKIYCNLNNI